MRGVEVLRSFLLIKSSVIPSLAFEKIRHLPIRYRKPLWLADDKDRITILKMASLQFRHARILAAAITEFHKKAA